MSNELLLECLPQDFQYTGRRITGDIRQGEDCTRAIDELKSLVLALVVWAPAHNDDNERMTRGHVAQAADDFLVPHCSPFTILGTCLCLWCGTMTFPLYTKIKFIAPISSLFPEISLSAKAFQTGVLGDILEGMGNQRG